MIESGHDADFVDERTAKANRNLIASKDTFKKATALCAKFQSGLEAEQQRLDRAV